MEAIHSVFFSPSGWDVSWHSGVTRALLEYGFPQELKSIGGGSGGALTAFTLACGTPSDEFDHYCDAMALEAKGHRAFGQMTRILGDAIDHFLSLGRFHNQTGDWLWRPYATVSTFGKVWPHVGADIVQGGAYQDHEGAKAIIMASCHIPGYFEAPAYLEGKRAFDGGAFIWDLRMPGVLNVSPHRPFGPSCIGYLPDRPHHLSLRSFLPNLERIHRIREDGYRSALRWIETFKQ